jgi:hypothetical protein
MSHRIGLVKLTLSPSAWPTIRVARAHKARFLLPRLLRLRSDFCLPGKICKTQLEIRGGDTGGTPYTPFPTAWEKSPEQSKNVDEVGPRTEVFPQSGRISSLDGLGAARCCFEKLNRHAKHCGSSLEPLGCDLVAEKFPRFFVPILQAHNTSEINVTRITNYRCKGDVAKY